MKEEEGFEREETIGFYVSLQCDTVLQFPPRVINSRYHHLRPWGEAFPRPGGERVRHGLLIDLVSALVYRRRHHQKPELEGAQCLECLGCLEDRSKLLPAHEAFIKSSRPGRVARMANIPVAKSRTSSWPVLVLDSVECYPTVSTHWTLGLEPLQGQIISDMGTQEQGKIGSERRFLGCFPNFVIPMSLVRLYYLVNSME